MAQPIARLFYTMEEQAPERVPELSISIRHELCEQFLYEVETLVVSQVYEKLLEQMRCDSSFVTKLCLNRSIRFGQASSCVVVQNAQSITLKTPFRKSMTREISLSWIIILQAVNNLLRALNQDILDSYRSEQHFLLALLEEGTSLPIIKGSMLPKKTFSRRLEKKVYKCMRQTYAHLKADTGDPLACVMANDGTFTLSCKDADFTQHGRVWCDTHHLEKSNGVRPFDSECIHTPVQLLTLLSGIAMICS